MNCECYRAEKNFLGKVGTCWGTAERDACSCGGDKSKCDFYPSVREEEKKPVTNYDRLVSKIPEEMAKSLARLAGCPINNALGTCPGDNRIGPDCSASKCWLDWLKQEATDA